MRIYPKSYHAAITHMIHFGAWNRTGVGRKLVARALRDLRANYPRERASRERRHIKQICGQFPVKPNHPLA